MASVTGLTAERSLEMAAAWELVAQRQAEADAEITSLRAQVAAAQEVLAEFAGLTVPEMQALIAQQAALVGQFQDTTVVNLDAAIAANEAALGNLGVDVYNVGVDVESQYVVLQSLPHTFTQPVAPVDGDDEDRPLMVGDRWNDTSTLENKEHRWDGTQWVQANITIDDLSLTVKKFKISTHMLY